ATTELSGAVIRYTLDGSKVTSSSKKYSGSLKIGSTKALRARAYKGGSAVSEDISQIYLIDYKGHLPVLSLATGSDKWTFVRDPLNHTLAMEMGVNASAFPAGDSVYQRRIVGHLPDSGANQR
ncbi:chitobiase/beta-hexosaminidase C-terminal domain-containing protein, partial [bacterium]|nr:chitobiase/beta-hexosaminidase C-terminal domain-containing protein [bacterium]